MQCRHGRIELGTVDVGYGTARYLEPDEVAAVAVALELAPTEAMQERMTVEALDRERIYPRHWDQYGVDLLQPNTMLCCCGAVN
jgi:hypothetical protein